MGQPTGCRLVADEDHVDVVVAVLRVAVVVVDVIARWLAEVGHPDHPEGAALEFVIDTGLGHQHGLSVRAGRVEPEEVRELIRGDTGEPVGPSRSGRHVHGGRWVEISSGIDQAPGRGRHLDGRRRRSETELVVVVGVVDISEADRCNR